MADGAFDMVSSAAAASKRTAAVGTFNYTVRDIRPQHTSPHHLHVVRAHTHQSKDDANVLAAQLRILTHQLAYELDDDELQHVGEGLDLVQHLRFRYGEITDGKQMYLRRQDIQ
jgi:hypothetical protein